MVAAPLVSWLRRLAPFVLVVALLLAALVAYLFVRSASAIESAPGAAGQPAGQPVPAVDLPRINAVYFAGAGRPGVDPALARGRGVRVVGSAQELAAEAATADAIAMDRDAFETVDPQWLADQLAQGRAIVAINVPGDRLGRITGYGRSVQGVPLSAMLQGRPFYSAVWQWEENGVSKGVSGTDVLYDPQSFLRQLYLLTPAGQADAFRSAPPVPTQPARPPATRTRP